MSRVLRVEFDGAVYHVMSRGVGPRKTYVDDSEIEQRHGRSPGAVTLAVRDLDREARTNRTLRLKLSKLAKTVGHHQRGDK